MEQACSRQCLRRSFYAVIIGVAPVAICLLLIAIARLILYRLELVYHRRQKITDRRPSYFTAQSGRLALSYTPVSKAELQRIILGEYQSEQVNDVLPVAHNTNAARKTPRFIKSILTRREPAAPAASSILANLVIRHDLNDVMPMTMALAPVDAPFQPTFTIVDEQNKRRPSVFTITRESIETTTLAATKANKNENSADAIDAFDSERARNDPVLATTKTMTTTTVVVEEFLDFHSVSSLPCVLSLLDSVSDNDNSPNFERNKDNEDD